MPKSKPIQKSHWCDWQGDMYWKDSKLGDNFETVSLKVETVGRLKSSNT